MIRLSRKAWNNVIIFAMLIMILLFNSTTNILNRSNVEQSAQPLLPDGAVLMTLESNGFKIERIGSGWRINSDLAELQTASSELVERWQSTIMHPAEAAETSGQPEVVVAWLAGESSGRVYQLYKVNEQTLVAVDDGHYVIHNTLPSQLTIQP